MDVHDLDFPRRQIAEIVIPPSNVPAFQRRGASTSRSQDGRILR